MDDRGGKRCVSSKSEVQSSSGSSSSSNHPICPRFRQKRSFVTSKWHDKSAKIGRHDGDTLSSGSVSSNGHQTVGDDSPKFTDDQYETDEHVNHINKLPVSILIHIFRMLPVRDLVQSAGLVCWNWYQMSRDPTLWHVLQLKGYKQMNDDALDRLTSYSDRISHLDLSFLKSITPEGFKTTLGKCSHLKKLSVTGWHDFPVHTFEEIGSSCPHLTKLVMDDCFIHTDNVLCKDIQSCPYALDHHDAVTMTVVVLLDYFHGHYVDDICWIQIFQGCRKLQHFSIRNCEKMTDVSVQMLSSCCPDLKYINLQHCEMITGKSVESLVYGCPQLDTVNLSECCLTDSDLIHLRKLTKLSQVYLTGVVCMTAKVPIEIARNCPHLQILFISLNKNVDDKCIDEVVRHATSLKQLKCISCTKLTNKALQSVGAHCKFLTDLDVSWCPQITNKGVYMVSKQCPNLHSIGLYSCHKVKTSFLNILEKSFPHIRYYTFVLESRRLIQEAVACGYLSSDISDTD